MTSLLGGREDPQRAPGHTAVRAVEVGQPLCRRKQEGVIFPAEEEKAREEWEAGQDHRRRTVP